MKNLISRNLLRLFVFCCEKENDNKRIRTIQNEKTKYSCWRICCYVTHRKHSQVVSLVAIITYKCKYNMIIINHESVILSTGKNRATRLYKTYTSFIRNILSKCHFLSI